MSAALDFVGDPGAFLVEARARIRALHDDGSLTGGRLVALITACVDNTLRGLFERCVLDGVLTAEDARDRVAIVAVGGYARRELCFHSDVDLLILTDGVDDAAARGLVEAVLYPLWDSKLQVGQAVGSVAELLAEAEDDAKRRHALLDLRLIAGSGGLFADLTNGVSERLRASWSADLVSRVRDDNLARWKRYGDSVFLLEPHVKEGRGGLRDLHWLLWAGRALHGLRGDMDFLLGGIMEPEHYRAITNAWEFLLRVRNQLHVRAGRAEDTLRFEHQEPIAKALGFKRRNKGLVPAERFMGEYYRHAWAIAHFTGLYAARLLGFYWDEEAIAPPAHAPLTVGPSAPVVRGSRKKVVVSEDGGFRLEDGSVRCTSDGVLKDPRRIMALFGFLQEHGGRLHHETMEEVRAASSRVTARWRSHPEMGRSFRAILEGRDVFRVLVAMHRAGFLGRYIPEFGAVFCQAQHNRVHLYTVDVHSLYAVRELERLGDPEIAERAPLFARAWQRAEPRGPLILAALFHDIAKSHGSAHSRVGAEWMPSILGRMGWDEASIERVQWLVRHHLVLSETAYHRDVHDPVTLAELAAIVPDRDHLDQLLALTFADTRATNPELWNSWKQSLVEQAWRAAARALDPDAAQELPDVDGVRARVEALLTPEVGRKRAPELTERLLSVGVKGQPRYLERTSSAVLATHAVLLDQLAHAERHADATPFVTDLRQRRDRGVSEWTVATVDRRGLFSLLAGVLGASGLSIVGATAVTRDDGVAIDTFQVVDQQGKPVIDARRWRRVDRTLGEVARGEKLLPDLLRQAKAAAPPKPAAGALELARVTVSNELSEGATVVEVVAQDRVGLLHDITALLRETDLDLTVARIATRQDMAADTFYVVDPEGQKLGAEVCRALRERLLGVLTPEERAASQERVRG